MKRVYIHPNLTEERYIEKVKNAIQALLDKGYDCVLNYDDNIRLYGNDCLSGKIEDCDVIVTLGGDGTFLRGMQLALEYDKPICGINCGNRGYLCACHYDKVSDIDVNNLKIYELTLLEFSYDDRKFFALNEVVIGKDYFGGTVELEYEAGEYKNRFKGDGLIICTATGSTAYNVSAGGEIFDEKDDMLGITPICSYDRNIRPVTIDENIPVKVRLINPRYSASIYTDGVLIGPMDEILIKTSERKIKVLK